MGLGWTELLLILVIVVVIFGVKRLPEIGSGLGQGITNYKKAMNEQESLDAKPSNHQKDE